MDIISRLPGCDGQAADAVSAYTQVKMEDAHILLKNPKSECPDIWIRLPRHKWPKSWSSMKIQWLLLDEICTVILWQDYYVKGNLRKSYCSMAGRKFQIGNVSLFIVRKDYSHLCEWMTSNWLERNKTLIRCGNYSIKKSTWENQHLSLIMYTWDALKDNEISKDIVDNYRTMFESRVSAKTTEKLPYSENLSISSLSYDMEGHAKKCVERYCELANKTTQQLYKVSTPCIDDHHFRRRNEICWRIVTSMLSNCCKMFILGTNWKT